MAPISVEIAVLLLATGVVAGVLNAVAGGATFATFPALLLAGLSPLVANATNFVALVPSNFAALPAFRSELKGLGRELVTPVGVGAFGGLLGALALVNLGGDIFASAVPFLMAFATILFATAPKIRDAVRPSTQGDRKRTSPTAMFLLFGFSIYGGYFGAGLGQIILAVLILNGYDDFHVTNALKNSVIAAISLTSVAVYGLSGSVSWPHALIMMVGATIGGFLGGAASKFVPQQALRMSVIILGIFLSIYYFVADL